MLVVLGLRHALTPWLGDRLPFTLFTPAAMLATWYGGLGPGLLTLGGGALLGEVLLEYGHQPGSFGAPEAALLIVYAVTTLLSIWLVEALAKARWRAEAANRMKEHFMAVLSHELRTPLTPVLAVGSALEADPRLPPDIREDMAMIRRNIELEARLIDDLLDISRIRRDGMVLDRELIDIHGIIAHAVQVCCDRRASSKAHHITTDLQAKAHCVLADVARLEQVFTNLLDNAMKHTPAGGHITIRTRNSSPDRLDVEIIDDGAGIESDLMPMIFIPFEQGKRSASRQHGGLGLGLAISKAIVDMHGGSIAAQSRGRNKGSTFTVQLPVILPPDHRNAETLSVTVAAAPETIKTASSSGTAAAVPGRSLQVLLVEDHPDTARIMAKLLAADGHAVHVAHDSRSALDLARKQRGRLDLVISDLGLPDGNGWDLMRQLRDRYGLKGIAVSGFVMEDTQRSKDAGFIEHLTKPLDLLRLQEAITQVVHAHDARPLSLSMAGRGAE